MKRTKKVLGYSGTVYDKYGKDRVDIRIIGKVTKGYFVEKVIAEFSNYSRNWIEERVCETGNEVEVNLANEQEGTIFILNENQQILESFSITKEAKQMKKEIQEVRIKVLGREKQLVALRKWREKKGKITKKELIKLYADNTITREELDKSVELRDERLKAEIKCLNDTIELQQKQRDYLWKMINKKAVELKDLEHELDLVF